MTVLTGVDAGLARTYHFPTWDELADGSKLLYSDGASVIASVNRYPRMVLSTPGTSGYRLSYKQVLRAVPHKPLRWGIF